MLAGHAVPTGYINRNLLIAYGISKPICTRLVFAGRQIA